MLVSASRLQHVVDGRAKVFVESHVALDDQIEQVDIGDGQVKRVDLGQAALVRKRGYAEAQRLERFVDRNETGLLVVRRRERHVVRFEATTTRCLARLGQRRSLGRCVLVLLLGLFCHAQLQSVSRLSIDVCIKRHRRRSALVLLLALSRC